MAAKESPYWREHAGLLRDLVARHTYSGVTNWRQVRAELPEPRPSVDGVRMKWGAIRAEWEQADWIPKPSPVPDGAIYRFSGDAWEHDSPTLTAAPFAVPIPAPPPPAAGGMVAVILPDTHMGMEDPKAVAVALAVLRDAAPDVVVHLGDLLDAYWLSRFDKDPQNATRLQDEIDKARVLLHQIAQMAPQARRVLLEGNHEARLTKAIWGMPGTAGEIGKLTAFREAITWPKLLGLEDIGWEWVPEHQQSRTDVLPGFIVKHGTIVRKWSGMSGRGEWEKYGKSGMSGHVHRLGVFYHRDHNGSHVWVECGCLCSLEPEYMPDPSWQQGLVVVTYSGDGERFNVEPIYIQDGRAVWRGREYVAPEA